MKLTNFIKRTAICLYLVLVCVMYAGCNKIESKADCLDRIFMEQTSKQSYYSGKMLDAINSNNLVLMEIYFDSVCMANYAFNIMCEELGAGNAH